MHAFVRFAGVALAACAAPAIAAVHCNPNPIADVPEFSPLDVRLEPDVLDRIVAACDPVSAAAEGVTSLLLGAPPGAEDPALLGTASSLKDVIDFARNTVAVAGGLEAHLLSCTGGALWDGVLEKVPSSITGSQKAYDELQSAREALQQELSGVEEKLRRNQPVSFGEKAKLAGAAGSVLKNAQGSVGALQGLLTAVAATVRDPGALLRSEEAALEVAASVARENIANLGRTCAVAQAEADVHAFVTLGQQSLTAVRLAQARAGKLARRDARLIDARLKKGLDWQRSPNVARDAIALGLISPDTYTSWVANVRDGERATEKRAALERALGESFALCTALQQQAAPVEQRRAPFQQRFTDGQAAIAACRLDDAARIMQELQALEGTACGAYLTAGLLADPPPDRSGLLGPTDPGTGTFAPPRAPIPPSAQLRHGVDQAREGCALALVTPPPPPPPPPIGPPVPPGATNVALVRVDPPEVPASDANWPTVTDGAIKYVAYPGSQAEITGDYTWGSPAATIGPQGVPITLTAKCNSVHDNTFATGIGIAVHNLDLYVDGKRTHHAEAPINCGRGEGLSATVSVQVVPGSSYSDGDVAQIRIGPFWAGSVVYTYKARKTSP